MNQILKYGLITISILIIGIFVSYGIFVNNFDLFGEPEKEILNTKCDNQGVRQATTFKYGGNAVTNQAILVSIDLGCSNNPDDSKKKIVFSAENKGGTALQTEWKSFDTLKIIYSDRLEPVTQIDKVTYIDSALNVTIIYEIIPEKEIENSTDRTDYNSQDLSYEFREVTIFKLTDTIIADFNGDGKLDQAIFRKENETSGIIITHGETNEVIKIGFGERFAHLTEFNWVDFWGIVNDSETYEVVIEDDEIIGGRIVMLENPSIVVRKEEVGGGLITFKERKYVWIHQAD
jgi:hypothetical protein